MSTLELPLPENLVAQGYVRVDSDVFNICGRIREISPNLRLNFREGRDKPWVVTEMSRDGVERFVAQYEEADGRILESLRYMLKVPLMERLRRQDEIDDRLRGKWSPEAEAAVEELAERSYHDARKAGVVVGGPSYRKVPRG